ncbi:MAG: NFACT RNA binding domain-containing protein [Gemmatimonadota bacterium]
MTIRWDSLLVRELAQELDRDLRGARLRALRLDGRTRDALLFFRDRTVVWRLHPNRGYVLVEGVVEPEPEDLRLRAKVRQVRAPSDERVLIAELAPERSGDGPFELVIELLGNRLNAIVTQGVDRRVRHSLLTPGGGRPVQVGHPYVPPTPTGRQGVDGSLTPGAWSGVLDVVPPPDRAKELVRAFAWVSPIVADTLTDDADLGFERWRGWADGSTPVEPCILASPKGPQPYPYRVSDEAQPAPSLIEAIRTAAEAASVEDDAVALGVGPALLARIEEALHRAQRRVVRLTAELDGREDPAEARAVGDLILARYGEIPAGSESVTLVDFEGRPVEVRLDPTQQPHENANRYYARASRSERAAERLPDLIRRAEEERARLTELDRRARAGDVEADEVRKALPARAEKGRKQPDGPSLPYRAFRSSGGLEIRVGRGAKHNDELTFRHSAPNDVWLHARHTAGAHVILRWPHSDNPPARDLEQAAALAAVHSKARTSGSAPVDWTRRKYVRKPRGSAPGSVLADRVQTVFVEPDEALVDELAVGPLS